MLYGCFFCGLLYLLGDEICVLLYDNLEAGKYLRWFALLAPMLYCDAITDAMIKGLGQQTACVRYNIITSSLDVLLLFILLPSYGIEGYFMSFFRKADGRPVCTAAWSAETPLRPLPNSKALRRGSQR